VAGQADADKLRLLEQLTHLDANYNGGLAAYITNAKRLLDDSRTGAYTSSNTNSQHDRGRDACT